jgi:O-antigen biosynthesis protein
MAPPSALFFVYVWPEPTSSAAGVRTRALIAALLERGWKVEVASPSKENHFSRELNALGVATLTCDPNASPPTDAALASLSPPSVVVYDRFVMEEQLGWRARAFWPNAFHVVDTQDLHSVRRARERLAKSGAAAELGAEELGEDFLRELSSLHRADAALVVSSWEKHFLETRGFPSDKLCHLAFPAAVDANIPDFHARSGFCFLGNFRHPPNLDSVRWLTLELWPRLKQRLPKAELHLYGAYPPAEVSRFQGKEGIFAHGPVADHRAALRSHRALLAPLRFGAGIKGKVLEAWATGTPVLGTALTFEGMGAEGLVMKQAADFPVAGLALHEEEGLWRQHQSTGLTTVRQHYDPTLLADRFLAFLEGGLLSLPQMRERNLTGKMLLLHQANSTKYFSRWIEAKNQKTLEAGRQTPL